MLTAKRQLFLSVALVGLLLLPSMAGAGRMTLVFTDVAGGAAEGKGALEHGWLKLKIKGLTPGGEFVAELREDSNDAPVPLGQFFATLSGRARLTAPLKGATVSTGTLIRVRRVIEGVPREVVLEGRVR